MKNVLHYFTNFQFFYNKYFSRIIILIIKILIFIIKIFFNKINMNKLLDIF